MNNMSMLYQIKKAGYHIVRLFPPRIRRFITPILSLLGLWGFLKFMIYISKSPILINISLMVNTFLKSMFMSTSNLAWGLLFVSITVYLLVSRKMMWKLISWAYLLILILGAFPLIKEVLKW